MSKHEKAESKKDWGNFWTAVALVGALALGAEAILDN